VLDNSLPVEVQDRAGMAVDRAEDSLVQRAVFGIGRRLRRVTVQTDALVITSRPARWT
jgi:hypothetical protein